MADQKDEEPHPDQTLPGDLADPDDVEDLDDEELDDLDDDALEQRRLAIEKGVQKAQERMNAAQVRAAEKRSKLQAVLDRQADRRAK